MEKDLKKILEEIKEITINPEETKRYILAIKRVFRKAYENCKEEITEEQILKECLQEYEEELKSPVNTAEILNDMRMYVVYKNILADYKGNKARFNQIVKMAKQDMGERENLSFGFDLQESKISTIKAVISIEDSIKEKDLIETIQKAKSIVSQRVRENLITKIQNCVGMLEEYGFIDEYIETSNERLESLGLDMIKFSKRNPIPDEQYEDGKLVKDTEDVGVMDSFSRENLEKLTLSDLSIMATFWESKYLEERMGLSKAMLTIKSLDLWDAILHEDDKAIEELENEKIVAALQKDLALTYLCSNDVRITSKLQKQYEKFVRQNNMKIGAGLFEEVASVMPETQNITSTMESVSILDSLLMYQLKVGEIKPKKCGIYEKRNNQTILAIENKGFRGPLLMGISDNIINQVGIDFPKYEKDVNELYSLIMSKIYIPSNNFFRNMVKQEYKKNPESKLLASLLGKKVKQKEEGR